MIIELPPWAIVTTCLAGVAAITTTLIVLLRQYRRNRGLQQLLTTQNALAERLQHELDNSDREQQRLREESIEAQTALKAATLRLQDQDTLHHRHWQAQEERHRQSLSDLKDAFRGLSAESLQQSHPEFLRMATQEFSKLRAQATGDLAQRQEAIAGVIRPLQEHLRVCQTQLNQSQAAQLSALGEVTKHLQLLTDQSQSLAGETATLRQILHSNQARGRWGEETLRRVVEVAGLSPHCDFAEQVSSQDRDGQPDLVVRLPNDRWIIVDSKVPDLERLADRNAKKNGHGGDSDGSSNQSHKQRVTEHAARLRQTIKALADRDYPKKFPKALDTVVLFLPAESLFSSALEGDPDLLLWASRRRITLATPGSLIALLRSISTFWQQHAQAENARRIADAATELYKRISRFTQHLETIGSNLQRATNAYNAAAGSYQRMVRPAGERLLEVSHLDESPLPELPTTTSAPQSP